MEMERVIKRYSNRKLYDPLHSRYVSLEEVAGLIRQGETVRVTDKDEQEDLTAPVLAQIIAEQGRSMPNIPTSILQEMIRWNDRAVDKGLDKISSALQKMGMFPDERKTTGLQESCKNLNEHVDRLEKIVEQLEGKIDE